MAKTEVFAWFEVSLLDFLTVKNQKEQMVEWFTEKMVITKRIIDNL